VRVLLDENLPHDLAGALIGHAVSTIRRTACGTRATVISPHGEWIAATAAALLRLLGDWTK
jgi:hypothetical protein